MSIKLDVLSKDFNLEQKALIEASAGTGKTFAVTHLALRMLLKGYELPQILLVTFTKASTKELKERLAILLNQTLRRIESAPETLPEYLQDLICDDGEKKKIVRLLKKALSVFDEARIYTIHGFCFHSLRHEPIVSDILMTQGEEDRQGDVTGIIRDFLRTEEGAQFSAEQLDLLLKSYGNDSDRLIRALSQVASLRIPIETSRSLNALHIAYRLIFEKYDSQKLFEDLCRLAPLFGKMCGRNREVKEEILADLKKIAFEHQLSKTLALFSEENRLQNKTYPALHHPDLMADIQAAISLVNEALDDEVIFSHLAERARQYLENTITQNDLLFFDDLLRKMAALVAQPEFAHSVRSLYKAVLIDEFQDTDPLQWSIFKKLFLEEFEGPVFVVGDPKQSIYRFRHADLYTYLEAKQSMSGVYGLTTNYRSSPGLIRALNCLLTKTEDFFPLPKSGISFSCPEIDSPEGNPEQKFEDGKGALLFWQCEEIADFYRAVPHEIIRLNASQRFSFDDFAVLVKDRYQAEAVKQELERAGIPSITQKGRNLTETVAYNALIDLLSCLEDLKDFSSVRKVLGGVFFGKAHSELAEIAPDSVKLLYSLKTAFEQGGIVSLCLSLIPLMVNPSKSLVSDCLQLMELASQCSSISETMTFLHSLTTFDPESEALIAKGAETGVSIVTIHTSKGLEFPIVFAPGLALSTEFKRELVLSDQRSELTLSPKAQSSHCLELDAEKMRQFYVATTRARLRLYLPHLTKEKVRKGSKSPMELFLQKRLLGRPLTTLESECKEISILPCGLLMADPVATLPVPLYRPIRPHVSIQRAFLTSFTSLANPEKEGGEALQPNPEEIPRGAATGIILHNFLEGLPFHEMKKENSRQALEAYLTPLVAKTELAPWPEKTVDMLHASISAPLPGLGKSLLDCDPAKMIREMRFLYKNTSNDLCQGFIDLFFELDGKFYILDWKSNALPDYSQDSLETAMRSCDYFLQANLYGEAACRYLHLFGKEKQFGGAFYVFLRGGAIYFVRPS